MTASSTDLFPGVKMRGGMGGERIRRIKINLRDISTIIVCGLWFWFKSTVKKRKNNNCEAIYDILIKFFLKNPYLFWDTYKNICV